MSTPQQPHQQQPHQQQPHQQQPSQQQAQQQPSPAAAGLASALAPLHLWWRQRTAQERQALQATAVVLVAALLWLLLVAPAWRTLQRAPAEQARLQAQWAEMQALAEEATALRAAPPVTPEQTTAALQAAVGRLGGRAQLSMQGDRAMVKLEGIGLHELGPWLQDLRAGARTQPLELSLSRGAAGYNGLLVLSRAQKP